MPPLWRPHRHLQWRGPFCARGETTPQISRTCAERSVESASLLVLRLDGHCTIPQERRVCCALTQIGHSRQDRCSERLIVDSHSHSTGLDIDFERQSFRCLETGPPLSVESPIVFRAGQSTAQLRLERCEKRGTSALN